MQIHQAELSTRLLGCVTRNTARTMRSTPRNQLDLFGAKVENVPTMAHRGRGQPSRPDHVTLQACVHGPGHLALRCAPTKFPSIMTIQSIGQNHIEITRCRQVDGGNAALYRQVLSGVPRLDQSAFPSAPLRCASPRQTGLTSCSPSNFLTTGDVLESRF